MFISTQLEHHVIKGTRLWAIFRGHTLQKSYPGKKRSQKNFCKQGKKKKKHKKTIISEKQTVHIFSTLFYFNELGDSTIRWIRSACFSPVCAACTYHRVHEEVCPSPRFSLYEVWRRSRRFHLEWVWQPDNFRGFDVIHIPCSNEQIIDN